MTTCCLLILVAVLEAVVYQRRYRATHGTPFSAMVWTAAVCGLRVAFTVLGVSAALKDQWWMAVVCYAVPAALVTGLVRWVEVRREARNLRSEISDPRPMAKG